MIRLPRPQVRLMAAVSLFVGLVSGQDKPPLSLQAVPNSLSLAGGERQQILAVITVNGDSIRNVGLKALPVPGLIVALGKAPDIAAGFKGDVAWPLTVTKADDGRASSVLSLQATYTSGDPPKATSGSSTTTLTVTLKTRPKIEEVVTAAIEASFDKLQEQRPQPVFLTLTNLTDVPLTIESAAVSLPDFARLKKPDATNDLSADNGWISLPAPADKIIGPRQESVLGYQLRIPDNQQIASGKYLLFFRANISYTRDGYVTKATVVTKKEFQVGVLGEDEFVGITTVPLLVLPGFIFVTALALLLKRVWPRWQLTLEYKNPEYYFLSILAALGGLRLYQWLSPLAFRVIWQVNEVQRNLFAGYALADIVNIWCLAVAGAILLWAVVCGSVKLVMLVRSWLLTRKVPKPKDRPRDLLGRLHAAKERLDLHQVTVGQTDYWLLPLPSPDPAKDWVSERIEFTVKVKDDELLAALDAVVQEQDSAKVLEALQNAGVKVGDRWEHDHGPQLVDKQKIQPKAGQSDPYIYIVQG